MVRLSLQLIAYVAFAGLLGFFATMPKYRYTHPGMASVKVSLSHAADRVEPCVQLTAEEIAELAANMRRSETCQRQRLPLILELDIDDEPTLRLEAAASGLWGDGPASVYERFAVAPGTHRISVRMRDSGRRDGWDYARSDVVILEAGKYFTVTFKAENGGFKYR